MIDDIFLSILNMSFIGSYVILFVLLARLFLKKVPTICSYALWSVVAFRLICPFSFESIISLLPVNTVPIPYSIQYEDKPEINTGVDIIDSTINQSLPAVTNFETSVNPIQIWIFIGSIIWLIGITIMITYSTISLLKFKWRLKNAFHQSGNIYRSSQIETAFVMGLFSPKIYLPENLSETERDYILLHEQTHIRRFDHLIKTASFLILSIHWFNPLVWVAFFISVKDMEMSCDEAVIKKIGSDVKKEYSTSLLSLATGRKLLSGSPLSFGEGDTKDRIKNVLQYKKPTFCVVVVGVMIVIVLVIGLMSNPKHNPDNDLYTSVTMKQIQGKSITRNLSLYDNANVITTLLNLLESENIVKRQSYNDAPMVEDYISILFQSTEEESIYFVYEEKSKYYVEKPYGDIQEINFDIVEGIVSMMNSYNSRPLPLNSKSLYTIGKNVIGKAFSVESIILQLPIPSDVNYDNFELFNRFQSREIEIVYKTSSESLEKYDIDYTDEKPIPVIVRKNALLLLALFEEVAIVTTVITDGDRKVVFINGREWAEDLVGCDIEDYAKSPEKLQQLIDFPLATTILPEYTISKIGEKGEVMQEIPMVDSEMFAFREVIVKNALVESFDFEGVDISTLKEYYLIQHIDPETGKTTHYYSYLLEKKAVLQYGNNGLYARMDYELYLKMKALFEELPLNSQEYLTKDYSGSLTFLEKEETEEIARNYFTNEKSYYKGVVSISITSNEFALYLNKGIEAEYTEGNIIIYKVLTGIDRKKGNPERFISIARDSKDHIWKVINQGY